MNAGTMQQEARVKDALARDDIDTLREAITSLAEHVRSGGYEELVAFQKTIISLSTHDEARVRQTVAGVTDILADHAFDTLLALFSADSDHYVRVAMERAAKRRATRLRANLVEAEKEVLITRLLNEHEKRHGKGARREADRIARRSTEYFIRKFHHEATKIVTPLEFSIVRLRAELDKPDLDRVTLARHAAIARERLSFLWSIIDRARTATQTMVPRFTRAPLRPLIDRARAHLVDRLGPAAERLHLTIDVDPALNLDADSAALLQALQNFLQNAVEAYRDEAARIDITVTAQTLRAASLVEILVTDHGPGMRPDALAQLFIPFTTSKPGGTGVGLLIARTMIEEVHGGTLEIESTEGVGTTVKITLPARQIGTVKS